MMLDKHVCVTDSVLKIYREISSKPYGLDICLLFRDATKTIPLAVL